MFYNQVESWAEKYAFVMVDDAWKFEHIAEDVVIVSDILGE